MSNDTVCALRKDLGLDDKNTSGMPLQCRDVKVLLEKNNVAIGQREKVKTDKVVEKRMSWSDRVITKSDEKLVKEDLPEILKVSFEFNKSETALKYSNVETFADFVNSIADSMIAEAKNFKKIGDDLTFGERCPTFETHIKNLVAVLKGVYSNALAETKESNGDRDKWDMLLEKAASYLEMLRRKTATQILNNIIDEQPQPKAKSFNEMFGIELELIDEKYKYLPKIINTGPVFREDGNMNINIGDIRFDEDIRKPMDAEFEKVVLEAEKFLTGGDDKIKAAFEQKKNDCRKIFDQAQKDVKFFFDEAVLVHEDSKQLFVEPMVKEYCKAIRAVKVNIAETLREFINKQPIELKKYKSISDNLFFNQIPKPVKFPTAPTDEQMKSIREQMDELQKSMFYFAKEYELEGGSTVQVRYPDFESLINNKLKSAKDALYQDFESYANHKKDKLEFAQKLYDKHIVYLTQLQIEIAEQLLYCSKQEVSQN